MDDYYYLEFSIVPTAVGHGDLFDFNFPTDI